MGHFGSGIMYYSALWVWHGARPHDSNKPCPLRVVGVTQGFEPL
jgi:hypothetical protein